MKYIDNYNKANKDMNFHKFVRITKRLLVELPDDDTLHQSYIDYKKFIRNVYYMSATDFIVDQYNEFTMDKHGNCLKRNMCKYKRSINGGCKICNQPSF